jgi:hypothetical protein
LPEVGKKRSFASRDALTGASIALVGLVALVLALDFDSDSRMFPAVAAGLLAVVGILAAVLAIVKPREAPVSADADLSYAALAVAAIALWALAFGWGAGFLIPTFLLQVVLLKLAGVQRPLYLLGVAAIVTGLAALAFVVLLDVPLPLSRMPGFLGDW